MCKHCNRRISASIPNNISKQLYRMMRVIMLDYQCCYACIEKGLHLLQK